MHVKFVIHICTCFLKWSNKTNHPQLLTFVFQPWVNLIRIDRLLGHWDSALNKLNALTDTHDASVMVNENKMSTYLFHVLNVKDDNRGVMNQILWERIKLYLHAQQYTELIQFIENSQQDIVNSRTGWVQEALTIGLVNVGKHDEALQLLTRAKSHPDVPDAHIFNLRECELRMLLKQYHYQVGDLTGLSHTSLRLLRDDPMNVNAVLIGLHTADLLKTCDMMEEAIKLIYFCLETTESIKDELLKAECLVLLYQYIPDLEGKRIIENLMIEHYYQTQYSAARRKMQACFHDLKYVENKYQHDDMTPLFEDLLILSRSIKI